MSVTTQAFTYAINHIENLMKLAAAETEKTIDNSAFDENDYFVIALELTPSGFIPNVSIESNMFETMSYHPNITAIFVDQGSKFLSWENPTRDDIEAFKNMLIIKLEQVKGYDANADLLAEAPQTRNITITDEDLEQSTHDFLKKHDLDVDAFIETLANTLTFSQDSIFKDANKRYFQGFLNQPFKHLATATSDDETLMLNDVFEPKGIHFAFEPKAPADNTPATIFALPINMPITWADTKNIVLGDNDSETGGTSHANETLAEFLEEINAMPEDQSVKMAPLSKYFINCMLDEAGIKPVFTNTTDVQSVVKRSISSAVSHLIQSYDLDNASDEQLIFFIARDGSLICESDDKLPYTLNVTLTAPNGSKYHSSLQLSSIINATIAPSYALGGVTKAIVSELKQQWWFELRFINTLANYSGSFIYGTTISEPRRKIPMNDLLEDQQYFKQASERLGKNTPPTKEG